MARSTITYPPELLPTSEDGEVFVAIPVEEFDRLNAERVDKAEAWDAIAAKNAELTRLRAELEEAKELLKPFATFAGFQAERPELKEVCRSNIGDLVHVLDWRPFRNASRFLSKKDET